MIRLKPKPTFDFKVDLAQPGTDERASLRLTGKHKGQAELKELVAQATALDGRDAEFLPLFLEGWDGVTDDDGKPVKFSQETVGIFIDSWPGAALVIFNEYCRQLSAGRLKN